MRTDRLDKLCIELEGTSDDLESLIEDQGLLYESVSIDEFQYIDSKVMCCDTCGFWVPTSQVDDRSVCNDCVIGEEY